MADEVQTTSVSETPAPTDTRQDKKGNSGSQEKTFTQAELDYHISKRIGEVKQASESALLKELGLDKTEDLKALVTEAKSREEAKKSELDKWADKYAKLEAKHTELSTRLEQALTERKLDQRNAAVAKALTEAKATDIDDLMAIIEKHYGDELASVLSAEGTVDDKALKGLVETVKKGRAKFFASAAPGSPSNNNGRVPQPNSKVELTGRSRF